MVLKCEFWNKNSSFLLIGLYNPILGQLRQNEDKYNYSEVLL